MDLCAPNDIRALLGRHGFRFSKALGQNFLIDPRVPREMAEASGAGPGTGVLEIGPGIGCLTVELARRADRVTAVEVDRALLPILEETLAGCSNVTVLSADVMALDLGALAAERFAGVTPLVCANLPYQITTPVLHALLACGAFAAVTVMVQREVAQRICAGPGGKDYGAFSLYCRYKARAELLFEVPRECFLPAPQVTSAVVRLTPQPPPVAVEEGLLFRVIRPAFTYRRKTLVNALANALPLSKEALAGCIAAVGLPPDVRGERLGLSEFAALAGEVGRLL